MGQLGDSRFRILFGHYDAFEETKDGFTYLDVKEMPIGLFGNILIRILSEYKELGLTYMDHITLKQDKSNLRVTFIFKRN